MTRKHFITSSAVGWLLFCGCYSAGTVRLLAGREVLGSRIPERAYAAYLAGALAESKAELETAKAYYAQALDSFESAELHTSAGRVECQLGNRVRAAQHFQDAEVLEPSYAPLFIDRARCLLQHQQPAQALNDALQAEALAPDDPRATEATATAFLALGKTQEAERHRTAYAVLHPKQRKPAPKHGSEVPTANGAATRCTREAVAAAISDASALPSDRFMTECRVSASELATLALKRGRATLALRLAQQALEIEPDNADVRALALLAAVRSGQYEGMLLQLAALPPRATTALSESGRAQLEELATLLEAPSKALD